METIKIPSPSAILDPPDLGPIINQSVGAAKQQARLSPPKQTAASSAKLQNTLNRPKQSKSRNGMRISFLTGDGQTFAWF